MNCLVSGATGFIGRQLCPQLVADGHAVSAVSRRGGELEGGLSVRPVDLATDRLADDLLRGVDVVLHLAGIAHRSAAATDHEAVNHRATLRLARQASAAGVGCFVFLSSVKAMGSPSSPGVRAEHDLTQPGDAYGLSKRQAERDLLREFESGPMSVVIIRPALVYGPGARGNLRQLARGVRWGLPRPPAGGSRSMVALGDLVDLLCVIARTPPAEGAHTWIACGPGSYSTRALYDLLRSALDKGRGREWLPRWAWVAAAGLVDTLGGRPARFTYERLFGEELYSNEAVCNDTAWQPRTRLEDVIGQVAAAGGTDR